MSEKKGVQLYYAPRILENETDKSDEKTIKRFIHAIIREEQDKFTELLNIVDVNSHHQQNKWTPLIWAVQKDKISFIQQIFDTKPIDFSQQIDHQTKRTLLHFAAEKSNLELLQMLLQKDQAQQDKFSANTDGDTDEKTVDKSAKKMKLKINAKDRESCTALFRAAKVGAPLVIKALLQHSADPNIPNRDGITPLMISSVKGYDDAVKILLGTKSVNAININMEDARGRTALMMACAEDRYNVAKLLLNHDGESINFDAFDCQNFEWNALMWCVYRKNEKILNLLLDNDGKSNVDYLYTNYHGRTVLDMCVKKKLSNDITLKLRAKYHGLIFPILAQSQIVKVLNIPLVVLSTLLVFTY